MRILDSLSEKSWIASTGKMQLPQTAGLLPQRIALRFFLGTISVIFFLFILTFLSRSQYPDFIALAGQPWQPLTDASQLWMNTGLLFCASLAMQWGVRVSAKQSSNKSILALALALMFTLMFIVAQLWVWQQLIDLGYYVNSNPANSFYYLLTAIHGAHLLGGVVVLLGAAFVYAKTQSLLKLHSTLSLCAHYWHYLLLVWVILFFLLTSSSETYAAIAALCGF